MTTSCSQSDILAVSHVIWSNRQKVTCICIAFWEIYYPGRKIRYNNWDIGKLLQPKRYLKKLHSFNLVIITCHNFYFMFMKKQSFFSLVLFFVCCSFFFGSRINGNFRKINNDSHFLNLHM